MNTRKRAREERERQKVERDKALKNGERLRKVYNVLRFYRQ